MAFAPQSLETQVFGGAPQRQTISSMMQSPDLMPGASQYYGKYKQGVVNQAFPEQALARAKEQYFPTPQKPIGPVAKDAVVFGVPDATGKAPIIADNRQPNEAAAFKPTNMQRPGTNDVRIARTQQDVDALANQGYALAGNSVPGAPAPKDPEKPNFGRQDYWRAQVKPFADSATNARVQASKVGSSLALGTGTGHIAAINALQKMIDEGAVVRDQDVALIQSAQSLAGRLSAQMETLKSGQILSPDLQEELRGVALSLENAIYQGVNERVSAYEPVMIEEGVKMDSVLPPQMRAMFTPKKNPGDALAAAKAAILNGADRAAVIQRLRDNGIDPRGL
jgi:hypothetical protein